MNTATAQSDGITGLVLAGGAGSRVNHQDKGLLLWRGQALVEHVVQRLSQQVDSVLISCNRNEEEYRRFGTELVTDLREDFQGPLAGIEAAASKICTELCVVAPCDAPHLPTDLVRRLTAPLLEADSMTQVAWAHDGIRDQYLFAALKRSALSTLPAFLKTGDRAVRHWYRRQAHTVIDFSDQVNAFRNYNLMSELNRDE